MGDYHVLPFAGITQIRFEGVSHPAADSFRQTGPLALSLQSEHHFQKQQWANYTLDTGRQHICAHIADIGQGGRFNGRRWPALLK